MPFWKKGLLVRVLHLYCRILAMMNILGFLSVTAQVAYLTVKIFSAFYFKNCKLHTLVICWKSNYWGTYQLQSDNKLPMWVFFLSNITNIPPDRNIANKCHNSLIYFKVIVSSFPRRLLITFGSFKERSQNCVFNFWGEISLITFTSLLTLGRWWVCIFVRCKFIKCNKNTRILSTSEIPLVPECTIWCSLARIFLQ